MAPLEPILGGALASHPLAAPFASEVARVHHRYAVEVVAAFALCPFLRDPDTAFGRFWVLLDRTPNLEQTIAHVMAAPNPVMHIVFPRARIGASDFERFASSVASALRTRLPDRPVSAAFHPEMAGGKERPDRLIGLLRRAPDPFVQIIPEGLHEGGTVFAESLVDIEEDHSTRMYNRLMKGDFDLVLARLEEIRADRDRTYAPYEKALSEQDQSAT